MKDLTGERSAGPVQVAPGFKGLLAFRRLKQRSYLVNLGVALIAAAYFAAVTAIPLVHNAWHERAHGHRPAHPRLPREARALPLPATVFHVHGHGPRAAHALSHQHHPSLPAPGSRAPEGPPSDPAHADRAPEHFGYAVGPAPVAAAALAPALAAAGRIFSDTTVFEEIIYRVSAYPRGPPPRALTS